MPQQAARPARTVGHGLGGDGADVEGLLAMQQGVGGAAAAHRRLAGRHDLLQEARVQRVQLWA